MIYAPINVNPAKMGGGGEGGQGVEARGWGFDNNCYNFQIP